mmetsp:Transcript_18678/g.44475  ORF Transcript_18678/g.44475 Transcript_18678/m.44475 type:complete len:206 (+) Transcript_18678:669-1286(+)
MSGACENASLPCSTVSVRPDSASSIWSSGGTMCFIRPKNPTSVVTAYRMHERGCAMKALTAVVANGARKTSKRTPMAWMALLMMRHTSSINSSSTPYATIVCSSTGHTFWNCSAHATAKSSRCASAPLFSQARTPPLMRVLIFLSCLTSSGLLCCCRDVTACWMGVAATASSICPSCPSCTRTNTVPSPSMMRSWSLMSSAFMLV